MYAIFQEVDGSSLYMFHDTAAPLVEAGAHHRTSASKSGNARTYVDCIEHSSPTGNLARVKPASAFLSPGENRTGVADLCRMGFEKKTS